MAQSGRQIGGVGGVGSSQGLKGSDPFAGIERGSGPALAALGVQKNVRGHDNLVSILSGLVEVANRTLKDLLKNF